MLFLVSKKPMKKQSQILRRTLVVLLLFYYSSVTDAQEYSLDPGHTLIEFNVERFMVGEVTGKFREYEGKVFINNEGFLEKASVTIKAASLDTDHEVRDGHLRSAIWLDAEKYTELSFVSTNVRQEGDELWVDGDLTIKDQTNTVSFPFELKGPFKDPTGVTTVGLTGDLAINRQDYGITFSRLMDNGELFIGNEVKIRIRALAMQIP